MRVPFVRFVVAAAFAATAAFVATSGYAADSGKKVSKELAKPLIAAQESMKANDFATALTHVKEAQAVPNRTPFDDYTINEFLANIGIAQKDYNLAATAYEAMADSPELPPEKKKDVLTNVILLDNNAGRFDNVKRYGAILESMGPLDPKVAAPLAVAYYNGGDTAKAQAIATQEMNATIAAGQVPQQGVLDIIARTQLKQNDLTGASKTLEMLVVNYNDPNDWGQLIDLAFSTKGIGDLDALNLYRLRVVTNATTSAEDYAIMGDVTTKQGYPGETVSLIEHGQSKGDVKAGDRAMSFLNAARAKVPGDKASLPSFDTQAKARKTGDYDVKLAEAYYGYGRYAEAEEAARRAVSKGGVKDAQEPEMILGIALAAQGKNAEAIDAFSKVTGNPVDERIAHLWTLYAQRKAH